MKKFLFPLLIFCLALTACGGKTPARTIIPTATFAKTPTQAAQPATLTPTATTSPATSPPATTPATTPAQTLYTLFFNMLNMSIADVAKSGVGVQPGGTANLNYNSSTSSILFACSAEPGALDSLVLQGTQALPLRPIATGVPVDGQGTCSTFSKFEGLAPWDGSILNLDLGRAASPFEKIINVVIKYITPASGGSGSGTEESGYNGPLCWDGSIPKNGQCPPGE